ncbi:alphaK I25 [Puccinia sorghi]|uniref:AlphaK I25 n=1 Tax=Puccinia sorghi TaxID=27349 RepID=A0A0L6UNE7_9BASI|nr:alphaK I25 [Puccinia sorghi]
MSPWFSGCPLTLYIDKTAPIGRGSMRVAYPAKVKNDKDNGTQRITNYVAKVKFIDDIPSLENHATNAQIYQALLCEFKNIIAANKNPLLTHMIKHKAAAFDLFLEHHKCNDVCRDLNLGEVIDLQWKRPSEPSEAQVPAHLLIELDQLPEAQDFFIPSQVILPVPSSVANPDNTSAQNLSEILSSLHLLPGPTKRPAVPNKGPQTLLTASNPYQASPGPTKGHQSQTKVPRPYRQPPAPTERLQAPPKASSPQKRSPDPANSLKPLPNISRPHQRHPGPSKSPRPYQRPPTPTECL